MRAAGPPLRSAALYPAARRRGALFFLRLPETASREPLQLDISVARLQLLESRKELLTRMCAEGRRLAFENNRPVDVTRWH